MVRNAENGFHLIFLEGTYQAGSKAEFIGLKQHVGKGDREVNCIGWMTAGHDKRWTIDRLATAYFESLEHNPAKSRKALSVDRNRYEDFIKPKLGSKEPKELQPLDIERLRRDLQKTQCTLKAKDATPKTLSPATIRATLTVLGRIINYGSNSGLCPALPFKIKKPKVSGVTIEDLNEEQLKRLLSAN